MLTILTIILLFVVCMFEIILAIQNHRVENLLKQLFQALPQSYLLLDKMKRSEIHPYSKLTQHKGYVIKIENDKNNLFHFKILPNDMKCILWQDTMATMTAESSLEQAKSIIDQLPGNDKNINA